MQFPVYRKYANFHSFFIIHSPLAWTEYKRLGKKYMHHDFEAVQFPEKLFVQDLIECMTGIEPSSAEEMAQYIN